MTDIVQVGDATIYRGDCLSGLREMPDGVIQTCVTSPPYFGLRDYGHEGQIGLEQTPDEYVAKLVAVFREVRRVLRDDGTLWLNLGDSYSANCSGGHGYKDGRSNRSERSGPGVIAGLPPKNPLGIPWRVAFALQADGWYLRQDIIWHKPNPMPESVTDRCTKAHEYIFLLSKSPRYFYDSDAIKEASLRPAGPGNRQQKYTEAYEAGDEKHRTKGGLVGYANRVRERKGVPNDATGETRNCRSVWTVSTKPFSGAHFAVFPPALIEPCILAGSAPGDVVLDPFTGSGTAGVVSGQHGRKFYGCELNPDYCAMACERIAAAYAQGRLFS